VIERGASLLLAYRLEGKRVLLVGGGAVAASRLGFLLESGAHVTIVAPGPLEKSMQHRVDDPATSRSVTWVDRAYGARNPAWTADIPTPEGAVANTTLEIPAGVDLSLATDAELPLTAFDMVLTAIDDNALSRAVCWACRRARIPVNVADVPPECDFYFGAQTRRGPLQVMVSTSGAGPKVAVMVRDVLADAIPSDVEEAIAGVGELRKELRVRAPGVGGPLSKRRMRWMIDTCNKWSIAQMGALGDPAVRAKLLDEGWEKHQVLGPRDVGTASAWNAVREWAASPSVGPAGLGFLVGGAAATAALFLHQRR
jgi:precorrin-2 dehydrogenase/sirohydrochlorin ferrochelatase